MQRVLISVTLLVFCATQQVTSVFVATGPLKWHSLPFLDRHRFVARAMPCLLAKRTLTPLSARKRTAKKQKAGKGFGKVPTAKPENPPDDSDSLTGDELLGAVYHFAGQFEEMFGDPSKVDDNRGLTPAQLARERVLCSRFDGLALHRSVIRCHGSVSGAGLFATRHIKAGEVITCYPGDALVYSAPGSEDDEVIFGWHVPASLARAEDCFVRWVDYGLFEDADYAVVGIPELNEDVAYAGHFCNDGAMLAADDEASVARYEAETAQQQNAMHTDLEGLHMVTVATRDIAAGEEVLVSYGTDYWLEHRRRKLTE